MGELNAFLPMLTQRPSCPPVAREVCAAHSPELASAMLAGSHAAELENPLVLLAMATTWERWVWTRSFADPSADLAGCLGLDGSDEAEARLFDHVAFLKGDDDAGRYVPAHVAEFVVEAMLEFLAHAPAPAAYRATRQSWTGPVVKAASVRLVELAEAGDRELLDIDEVAGGRALALAALRHGVDGAARTDSLRRASTGHKVPDWDLEEVAAFLTAAAVDAVSEEGPESKRAEQYFEWLEPIVTDRRSTLRFDCADRIRVAADIADTDERGSLRWYAAELDVRDVVWQGATVETSALFERASSSDASVVSEVAAGLDDISTVFSTALASADWAVRRRIAELIVANPAARSDALAKLAAGPQVPVVRDAVLAGQRVDDTVLVELLDDPELRRDTATRLVACTCDPREVMVRLLERGVAHNVLVAFATVGAVTPADVRRLRASDLERFVNCGHPLASALCEHIIESLGPGPHRWALFVQLAAGSPASLGELLDSVDTLVASGV